MPVESNSLRTKVLTKPMPTYTGYVCFRCGQKGHFIQFCPTNIDKSFDFIKLRKPTGIPKAFLKQINKDENEDTKGLMVTEKGLVKAEPQIEEWNKLKITSCSDVPEELKCKACNALYSFPVKINCGHVFCEDCISAKERCLFCEKKITSVLEAYELRNQIETYFEKNL
jgi:protein MPE1